MEEMFKYKQVIREDGVEVITIIHKGIHTFNPTSLVFKYIKECIDANKAIYPVDDLISQKVILPSKMEIKNHKFTILGEELDDDLIKNNSTNLVDFQNLFLNLNNHNFDKDKTLKLIKKYSKNIKPLTSDGFVFVVDQKDDFSNTPIYYYTDVNLLINKYNELNFGKKLNRKLIDSVIHNNEININPIILLNNFKDELDENQLRELLDFKINYPQTNSYKKLLEFYKYYFNTPKSFFNLLKKQEVKPIVLDKFHVMKNYLDQNSKITCMEKYTEYLNKSYELHKDKLDWEALIKKHPVIEKMSGKEISKYTIKSPKNSGEVILWGNLMGNCYATRQNSYNKGSICLFGLFSDNKLVYVFEIIYDKNNNARFGDFEGKRREKPSSELRSCVIKSFMENSNIKIN